jgi:hypothetical protein
MSEPEANFSPGAGGSASQFYGGTEGGGGTSHGGPSIPKESQKPSAGEIVLLTPGAPEMLVGRVFAAAAVGRSAGAFKAASEAKLMRQLNAMEAEAGALAARGPAATTTSVIGTSPGVEGVRVARSVGAAAAEAGIGRSVAGTQGLQHSFDRHAAQWFGRPVGASTHLGQWQAVVERASMSGKQVNWMVGDAATVGHLARIEGKNLFVQFYQGGPRAGELATAFVPNRAQLQAIMAEMR